MRTLLSIIIILVAIVALLLVIAGAMYVAIIAVHERRWRKIKSKKYEQFNEE